MFCLISFFEQVYSCKNSFELLSYYLKVFNSFLVVQKRNLLVITPMMLCYVMLCYVDMVCTKIAWERLALHAAVGALQPFSSIQNAVIASIVPVTPSHSHRIVGTALSSAPSLIALGHSGQE